jgi:hypothetical protein
MDVGALYHEGATYGYPRTSVAKMAQYGVPEPASAAHSVGLGNRNGEQHGFPAG